MKQSPSSKMVMEAELAAGIIYESPSVADSRLKRKEISTPRITPCTLSSSGNQSKKQRVEDFKVGNHISESQALTANLPLRKNSPSQPQIATITSKNQELEPRPIPMGAEPTPLHEDPVLKAAATAGAVPKHLKELVMAKLHAEIVSFRERTGQHHGSVAKFIRDYKEHYPWLSRGVFDYYCRSHPLNQAGGGAAALEKKLPPVPQDISILEGDCCSEFTDAPRNYYIELDEYAYGNRTNRYTSGCNIPRIDEPYETDSVIVDSFYFPSSAKATIPPSSSSRMPMTPTGRCEGSHPGSNSFFLNRPSRNTVDSPVTDPAKVSV